MRVGANAVGPDQGQDGSGVDRRLISEEPMVWSCVAFALPLTHFILAVSSPLFSTWGCRVCLFTLLT